MFFFVSCFSPGKEVRSIPKESQQRYDPRNLHGLWRLPGTQTHAVQQLRHRQTVSNIGSSLPKMHTIRARIMRIIFAFAAVQGNRVDIANSN